MPAKIDQDKLVIAYKLVIAFACLALAAVFSSYMVTGTFMRLSGDDYCYDALERQQGFWQAQSYAYLHRAAIGSNGIALTMASSIASQVGTSSSRFLPGLVLVLWLAGGFLLAGEIARLLAPGESGKKSNRTWEALLAAGTTVFFTLYMAPNLGQSFYWRSGLLTYIMPLALITYTSATLLSVIRRGDQRWWAYLLLFILAFIGGGFSEAITPMQLGLFGLAFATVGVIATVRRQKYAHILKPLAAVLAGTGLAMTLMILSPVNHLRQQGLPTPPGIAQLVSMSVENTFVFYKISVLKQFLPNLLCGLGALALAYLVFSRRGEPSERSTQPFSITRAMLIFIGLAVAGYALIMCVMAAVAFGISSYPDLRTLIATRWIMVVQLSSMGWLAGWSLAKRLKVRSRGAWLVNITSLAAVIGVGILAIAAARDGYAQLPTYQRWASYWDVRNEQILQAKLENQTALHVMEIDHIIQGVDELRADPFFWYNVCAARYYGIQRIYADLPGWDK